jgi:hypothetical protein
MNGKDTIVGALRSRGGRADAPEDLQLATGLDPHSCVHLLWRLQKEGRVTFRELHRGSQRRYTSIRLTGGAR